MAELDRARARLAALQAAGAAGAEPLRVAFAEALARRAEACADGAQGVLAVRLAAVVDDLETRIARARAEADAALAGLAPSAAEALAPLREAGNLVALRGELARRAGRGSLAPLAALVAHIGQHATESLGEMPAAALAGAPQDEAGRGAELKAVRYFRKDWSRLSVIQQLTRALAQVPENAGPLNSHYLALRVMKEMHDIAPEYLKRFLSHLDALQWLDQTEAAARPAARGSARGEGARARRSRR